MDNKMFRKSIQYLITEQTRVVQEAVKVLNAMKQIEKMIK